jgi:hypothetical protein
LAGEGVNEVLQLEEGTWEVRCGPKGADEGGTGELNKGERNGGTTVQRRHDGGDPVGRRGREAEERGDGGDGVLRCAREGGREGKERWRAVVMGHPL